MMKVIQITLPEELLDEVDDTVKALDTTRSELAREALRRFLARLEVERQEREHAEAYARQPEQPGEFDVFYGARLWDQL